VVRQLAIAARDQARSKSTVKKSTFGVGSWALLAALLVVCNGIACSRESDEPASPPVATAAATKQLTFSYEAYGQLHNDGLDYLDANRASPHGDPATNDRLIGELLRKLEVAVDPQDIDYQRAADFSTTYLSEDPASAVAKMHAAGLISAAQLPYVEDLVSSVTELATEKDSPDTRIWDYVSNLEGQITGDANLSDQERDQLLKMSSVMRYSARHWYAKSLQEAEIESISRACRDCLRRNWWVFVIYDGAGALSGAIASLGWGSIGTAIFVSFWSTGIYCPQCY
jgi:hypothetical protein